MLDDAYGEEELMTVQGWDGYGDYGELYQAPDGALYEAEELSEADDISDWLGEGIAGEIRQAPDGQLYQWVEGYDGLGNPVGFWSMLPAIAKAALPLVSRVAPALLRTGAGQVLRRVLPEAGQILRRLTPPPRRRRVRYARARVTPPPAVVPPAAVAPAPAQDEELNGIGALYQAPDGTLYQQVQGVGPEDLIEGFDEDEQLADEEFIRGSDDEQLADDDELSEDVAGYVREEPMAGIEAYVPEQAPQTRWFARPGQPPEMWRPLW